MSKRRSGFLALTLVLLVLGSILLSVCSIKNVPATESTGGTGIPEVGHTETRY